MTVNDSVTYLERAIADGHVRLFGEGKQQKIVYQAVNHTERFADPEEHVRAEFYAELIYRYGYDPDYSRCRDNCPRPHTL